MTQTPLRITLGGGGTDLPNFYTRHGGFILAMTIDKYVYVTVNESAVDHTVRLNFADGEIADTVSALRNELTREALLSAGYADRVEVGSSADVPSGTGLGSSGAYLVGLLHALHAQRGRLLTATELAEEASRVEMEALRRPVGKQDPYVAAHGGLPIMHIARDGSVHTDRLELDDHALGEFTACNHLYYTGVRRQAAEVLQPQSAAMGQPEGADQAAVTDAMLRIRDIGLEILDALRTRNFTRWGQLTHQHWCEKRTLSSRVSLSVVDEIYDEVRSRYGVLGGKIIGAGGGGFVLLYTEKNHDALERFMQSRGMPRVRYEVSRTGSRVLAGESAPGAERGRTPLAVVRA